MDMLKFHNHERQLTENKEVTHLASPVGCSVGAARTAEAAGIVVAEMSSIEGEAETFGRKM